MSILVSRYYKLGTSIERRQTMKYLLTIPFLLIATIGCAQEHEISSIKDSDLVKFANSSDLIASSKDAQDISVKIYLLHNDPGSAGYNSGEVTHNIIVAISEYGEYPKQSLFVISEFYNPSFINWSNVEKNAISAQVKYGSFNNTMVLKLRITIDGITIE